MILFQEKIRELEANIVTILSHISQVWRLHFLIHVPDDTHICTCNVWESMREKYVIICISNTYIYNSDTGVSMHSAMWCLASVGVNKSIYIHVYLSLIEHDTESATTRARSVWWTTGTLHLMVCYAATARSGQCVHSPTVGWLGIQTRGEGEVRGHC